MAIAPFSSQPETEVRRDRRIGKLDILLLAAALTLMVTAIALMVTY